MFYKMMPFSLNSEILEHLNSIQYMPYVNAPFELVAKVFSDLKSSEERGVETCQGRSQENLAAAAGERHRICKMQQVCKWLKVMIMTIVMLITS